MPEDYENAPELVAIRKRVENGFNRDVVAFQAGFDEYKRLLDRLTEFYASHGPTGLMRDAGDEAEYDLKEFLRDEWKIHRGKDDRAFATAVARYGSEISDEPVGFDVEKGDFVSYEN